MLNKEFHGYGVQKYYDTTLKCDIEFQGVFQKGLLNGPAKTTRSNGELIIGYFKDDKMDGKCYYLMKNGSSDLCTYKADEELECHEKCPAGETNSVITDFIQQIENEIEAAKGLEPHYQEVKF